MANWLKEERFSWRGSMLAKTWQEPHILKEYRENRESDLWRASRQAEQLCEYILYLESMLGSGGK
jgi:hypothetical protein